MANTDDEAKSGEVTAIEPVCFAMFDGWKFLRRENEQSRRDGSAKESPLTAGGSEEHSGGE